MSQCLNCSCLPRLEFASSGLLYSIMLCLCLNFDLQHGAGYRIPHYMNG